MEHVDTLRTRQRTAADHAEWYQYLAQMLDDGRLAEVTSWPKWVKRNQTADWYRTEAARLDEESAHAGDVANALCDLHHVAAMQSYTPEHAKVYLNSEIRHLRVICDRLTHDLPHLTPKLTTAQCEGLAWRIMEQIRPVIEGLGVIV